MKRVVTVEEKSVVEKEKGEQITVLKKLARKTRDRKLRQRYDIVRLFLLGKGKKEIALIMDVSLTQVYLILNLYKDSGIEGLTPKRPTGRKTKLTAEQEAEVYRVITRNLPKDVGLHPYCNWTAPLACKYVKDTYGVEFSERGMRDVFYRLGLSYTRPTYVLAKADCKSRRSSGSTWKGLKKLLNGEIAHLLYEDESMIRDYQAIQKTWFARGQQRIIPTCGKHEGVKLVGFLNYETGEVYVSLNSEMCKWKKHPTAMTILPLNALKYRPVLSKNSVNISVHLGAFWLRSCCKLFSVENSE